MIVLADVPAPDVDYKALSPLFAVLGGSIVVLMAGLFSSRFVRMTLVPLLTAGSLAAAIGLSVWNWDVSDTAPIMQGALASDTLALSLSVLIYIAGLVFEWVQTQGGLAALERVNIAKAKLLYDFLDETPFYSTPVRVADRSRMNVPFKLKDEALDEAFLKGASERGMVQLKGHRSVGGMRASIYNAMPLAGVQTLVDYMRDFAVRHG